MSSNVHENSGENVGASGIARILDLRGWHFHGDLNVRMIVIPFFVRESDSVFV